MKFISLILNLGKLTEDTNFVSVLDKSLSATVKTNFVIGSGLMDYMQKPYFHFQAYKPDKKPTGDQMAQLIEAFLIAQEKNADRKPLYACEVVGKNWRFFCKMENTNYCLYWAFNSTIREDLLQIIAILDIF